MRERLHKVKPDRREEIVRRVAAKLRNELEVLFAYLYGSFIESDPFYDIDLGVYLSHPTAKKATAIAVEVAERLSSPLKLPVDVRSFNFAPTPFLDHVFRGRRVRSRDDDVRSRIVERSIQCYLDIAPLLRHSTREAFAV